jgi:hypothetical protein
MNLAEARAEFGARGFDGILSASRMNFYLNRALVDFEDFYPWPWLRKQTTGAAPLQISDLKYVRSVFDSTGNEYFGLDDAGDVYRADTGTPTAGGSTTRPALPRSPRTRSARCRSSSTTSRRRRR